MNPGLGPVYQPLNTAKSEIRVLKVPRKDSNEDFELHTVSLDEKPVFVALSYVWGDEKDRRNITIQGRSVSITKNLEAFLSKIRERVPQAPPSDPQRGFYVWADALCIDQKNPTERSQQVALMYRIFSSALFVFAWLGSKDHTLAFQALQILALIVRKHKPEGVPEWHVPFQLEWLERYPRLCREEAAEPGAVRASFQNAAWDAISGFLVDPYWDRVWIFQEVVLARKMTFLSQGTVSMSLNDLAVASFCMGNLRHQILAEDSSKPDFLSGGAWSAITTRKIRWETVLDLAVARISVNKKKAEPEEQQGVRWDIAATAARLKATKPEDYIYGLLGISNLPITPDYRPERRLADLYTDYVHAWLEACRNKTYSAREMSSLSFLCVAGIGHFGTPADFPSWAPNYPKNYQGQAPVALISIGVPEQVLFPEEPNKAPFIEKSTKTLCAWGFEIGRLVSVSPGVVRIMNQEFLAFVVDFITRHRQYLGIPPLQAILRLLTREYTGPVTGTMVMNGFSLLCLLDILDETQSHNFLPSANFEARFADLLFPDTDFHNLGGNLVPAIIMSGKEVADRIVADLVWNWDTWGFIETANGYLGIAPSASAAGDVLCLLNGSNIPVVLREKEDGRFTFVGTTHVLGLMDGEAADYIRTSQPAPRRFEIQ